ncbi:HD domain-containing protein [Nostoc sp. FACHB-152]|uniref:phosphonate degradation HD-domain oxygenase n=1 Tax=unclassified Nostoc TaxID=2593658 RepID=UPI001683943D|nr:MULTISPECIES: phosphonate degradation HD-domain oxygenase [unclassified Nostoc]MBD2447807.1 HD domain-containing protein [Nostoc sp. FACHB-152]MBD2467098.1 HD domain-containing protein [Nostoc sp. FACHB-145]
MKPTIESIINLFTEKGSQLYGAEAVSQLEHALQCASLAEKCGQSHELITACLLHDLGHLTHDLGNNPASQDIDDKHEHRAIPLLQKMFSPAVTEPIRLHVVAKRYLCSVVPEYWDSLSAASKRSLELQGGIFSPEQAEQFIQQPYAQDAVQLRIFDDKAKISNLSTPDLNYFIPFMTASLNKLLTVNSHQSSVNSKHSTIK